MHPRIGKYEIRRELGRGAASVVYLAYDSFYNSELAVKVYNARAADSGDVSAQFVSEAALAGRLDHPHIVAILDAVSAPDYSYVAMEYVPGGNLHRYTAQARLLPVEDVIQIGFKCCGALDYAFREGVVHRDIKPANILLGEGTDVKVGDFGAAFVHGAETTQRNRMGSPSYIAPEQILNEPLTHQSDMFSLGVVLYELLSGTRPFRGGSPGEIMQQVLASEPPALSSVRAGLPDGIDAIVTRMLRKQPRDRHESWADLALDIARVGGLSRYAQAVPDSEKFTALRRSALLAALSDAEVWELAGAGVWQHVPAHTAVIREGETGDSVYVLGAGEVKVTLQGRLLDVLRQGEAFGEMSYIRGEPSARMATVQTTGEALIAELPRLRLDSLSLGCQLHFTRALLRASSERLALSNARVTRGNSG